MLKSSKSFMFLCPLLVTVYADKTVVFTWYTVHISKNIQIYTYPCSCCFKQYHKCGFGSNQNNYSYIHFVSVCMPPMNKKNSGTIKHIKIYFHYLLIHLKTLVQRSDVCTCLYELQHVHHTVGVEQHCGCNKDENNTDLTSSVINSQSRLLQLYCTE